MALNIRTKLLLGLVGLCGLFGITGWVFYHQIQTFDQDAEELEDLANFHLQRNVGQLFLESRTLTAFERVLVALNKAELSNPETQAMLAMQLASFEAQATELLQNSAAPVHDHNHGDEHQHAVSDAETDHHHQLSADTSAATHHDIEHDHDHDHGQDGDHGIVGQGDEQASVLPSQLVESFNTLEIQSSGFGLRIKTMFVAAETNDRELFETAKQGAIASAPHTQNHTHHPQ